MERGGPGDGGHEMTLDEELLLWLGDEPPEVRAADAERVRDIAGEFAAGFSALASIEASVSSAMFFLNDLMPLAKSPMRVLILLPPNSSITTSSTISQCQMLKLPMVSSGLARGRRVVRLGDP